MRLAIFGTGSQARVVLNIIQDLNEGARAGEKIDIAGFVYDRATQDQAHGHRLVQKLEELDADHFIVAIGDNKTRKEIFLRHCQQCKPATLIHPTAYIARGVTIGAGTVIHPHATVHIAVKIGQNVILNTQSLIDHDSIIQDHAHVSARAAVTSNNHVGEGSLISVGALMRPGARVGMWSVIGAGAVVIKDIPDYSTAYGVPARVHNKKSHPGTAPAAIAIFVILFYCLSNLVTNRPHVDVLVRKITSDRWIRRLEQFMYQRANPQILILGSSTSFVPFETHDLGQGNFATPSDFVSLQKWSESYIDPKAFLRALASRGIKGISAKILATPAASISDQLVILRKALIMGKSPKLIIACINDREFAITPAPDALDKGGIIEREIRDIGIPSPLVKFAPLAPLMRVCAINLRPARTARVWEDERFYFVYKLRVLTRQIQPIRDILDLSSPLKNLMANAKAVANPPFNVSTLYGPNIPLPPTLLPSANATLSVDDKPYQEQQIKALYKLINLTSQNHIKVLIVKMPMFPGVHVSPHVSDKINSALTAVKQYPNVSFFDPASRCNFEAGDFVDGLHMCGYGGAKLVTAIADYIAGNKCSLLPGSP
ncbi:MAG: acetyltransferase [Candidatus Melainabacteria bacterium]|nr:acetyltransferase [Candidatus Melainabacteria bacterium]